MNKEVLVLKLIEMLIDSGGSSQESKPAQTTSIEKYNIGKMVIVRCRDAGVHYGELVNYEGREVVLKNSRRMYYWRSAKSATLSACAVYGIKSNSRIMAFISGEIVLPEACEILPCSDESISSIGGADEYTAS